LLETKNLEIADLQKQITVRDTKILNLESDVMNMRQEQTLKDALIEKLQQEVNALRA
jgi:hypothetical protein